MYIPRLGGGYIGFCRVYCVVLYRNIVVHTHRVSTRFVQVASTLNTRHESNCYVRTLDSRLIILRRYFTIFILGLLCCRLFSRLRGVREPFVHSLGWVSYIKLYLRQIHDPETEEEYGRQRTEKYIVDVLGVGKREPKGLTARV